MSGNNLILRKKTKGNSLAITLFVTLVACALITSMMNVSGNNTQQITDNRDGLRAYYAAEAGVSELYDYFNSNSTSTSISWPTTSIPSTLTSASILSTSNTGTSYYWVADGSTSTSAAIFDVVGKANQAYRKIRVKLTATSSTSNTMSPVFNNYGILSGGNITNSSNVTFGANVHTNGYATFSGTWTASNGATATQTSTSQTARSPFTTSTSVTVPVVPISTFKTLAKAGGYTFNGSDSNLSTEVANAPSGSIIYISGNTTSLTLTGDLKGKKIFLDGSWTTSSNQTPSDGMIIVNGSITTSGNITCTTTHSGYIDFVLASGNAFTFSGNVTGPYVLWTNGNITFSGNVTGRIIAGGATTFSGNVNVPNPVYDNGWLSASTSTSSSGYSNLTLYSWQLVPMNN